MKSYECITDKSIIEVKAYLLLISQGRLQQDIHDIINQSIDNRQLKNNIKRRKDIELVLFIKIKKLLDRSESLDELEEHLVFMNILLENHYKPLVSYKYNLFNYVINNQGFNTTNYCILRHLIKFDYKQLPQFINYMCKRLDSENYHYLASDILLLEKQYKQAYQHLGHVCFDETLQKYRKSLYNYSPRKFNRYINDQESNYLLPALY